MGPGYSYTDHFINRRLDDAADTQIAQVDIDEYFAQTNWIDARNHIEYVELQDVVELPWSSEKQIPKRSATGYSNVL